jgi:hypothetical protein
MRRIASAARLMVVFLAARAACCASVSGYVVDSHSREPLPAAAVMIKGTDRGVSTNLDGFFILDRIQPAVYTLHIRCLGYRSRDLEVAVRSESSPPLTVEIEPSPVLLSESRVMAGPANGREERLSPRVSTVPVEARLIRMMPSLGGEMDVLRALQTIPGVKASSDLSSALHVRGGSPDQTLIMMDHNVVYNPSHLFGIFSTFNADAVKHLELIKGGFPARYGGRSGSVLEVITNEGNRRRHQGLFSLGIVSARTSYEAPLPGDRGSFAASFRRTYMDPILAALRSAPDTDLPDYYFYDANGKINFDLTPTSTLTTAGYWGNDRMNLDFGPSDARLAMNLTWGNRTLSSRWRRALGRNKFLSVGAAVSLYRSGWEITNEEVILDKAKDLLDDYSIKSDLEITHGNHQITTGLWASAFRIQFREETQNLVYVDVNERWGNYALYVQDRWRASSFLEVLPGLRGYYHDAGDWTALDPRLAVVYYWDPSLRFKAAGGRYAQFINLASFGEGMTNFDIWIPIDKSMLPSYTYQGILGVEKDIGEDLEFTAESYYTDMRHIAAFDPMSDQGEEAGDAFVQGKGQAYGLELMLRRKMGRLSGDRKSVV